MTKEQWSCGDTEELGLVQLTFGSNTFSNALQLKIARLHKSLIKKWAENGA